LSSLVKSAFIDVWTLYISKCKVQRYKKLKKLEWSWTKHYNAHSEYFQLFKTKEHFLVIKTCGQRESEFPRVVELSLPS